MLCLLLLALGLDQLARLISRQLDGPDRSRNLGSDDKTLSVWIMTCVDTSLVWACLVSSSASHADAGCVCGTRLITASLDSRMAQHAQTPSTAAWHKALRQRCMGSERPSAENPFAFTAELIFKTTPTYIYRVKRPVARPYTANPKRTDFKPMKPPLRPVFLAQRHRMDRGSSPQKDILWSLIFFQRPASSDGQGRPGLARVPPHVESRLSGPGTQDVA